MADYNKIGLLVVRNGRLLLCRKKHGTQLLILPGGCLEEGESPLECLAREIREELGNVAVEEPAWVGHYSDRAAGSEGKTVAIELYRGELIGDPVASSEIAELVWFGEGDDLSQLSPSLINKILPDIVSRGLLPWSPID